MNPDLFNGFILESRGVDINGDRLLRLLVRTRFDGKMIPIPSLQETNNFPKAKIEDYDYVSFAAEMGIDSIDARSFTVNKIDELVTSFHKLDIPKIHSQLKLGDFVEFVLQDGCSLWYKKEDANLNDTYEILFDNANEIAPNWFILPSIRTNPILNGHPSNVEIEIE